MTNETTATFRGTTHAEFTRFIMALELTAHSVTYSWGTRVVKWRNSRQEIMALAVYASADSFAVRVN